MTPEIVLGALGLFLTIFVWIIRLTARMAVLEDRTKTLWNFQLRRGFGEALHKGFVEQRAEDGHYNG